MIEEEETEREYKSNLLLKELGEYGYNKTNKISQNELFLFLDLKSQKGKFEPFLSEKLLNILKINERSAISIDQFISGFLKFDDEIRKDAEKIKSKYIHTKESYNNILEKCEKYKSEKLNIEGFSNEGKLSGEILDMNLITKLEGVQELILKIVYSGQEFTLNENFSYFNMNEKTVLNKAFKFKAHTKKDNLVFILQGKNDFGYISDLGSKEYSFQGLSTQDEILLKVEISENENEENIIAEINVKLKMHWSYFKYYDTKRKMEEPKLNQLKLDLKEIRDHIKNIDKIYGEEFVDSEIYIDKKEKYYTEGKLQQNNNKKKTTIIDNKDINNNESYEFPIGKYVVEFNNVRIIDMKNKGMIKEIRGYKVDFNNKIDFVKDENSSVISKKEENKEEIIEDEKNENENINLEKSIGSFKQKDNNEKENENQEQNEEKNIENEEQNIEQNNENNDGNIQDLENEPLDENEQNKELNKSQNINNESQNLNENIEEKNKEENNDNIKKSINASQNQNIKGSFISQNEINNSLNLQQNKKKKKINIKNKNPKSTVEYENNNINKNQSYPMVNQSMLGKSTNKIIVQEKILPIKYLPDKVNKVIFANNINTLPLIEGNKSVTYTNLGGNSNFFGMTDINQNIPVNMSYQPQMMNNNIFNVPLQGQIKINNQTSMSYQVPNYWK